MIPAAPALPAPDAKGNPQHLLQLYVIFTSQTNEDPKEHDKSKLLVFRD